MTIPCKCALFYLAIVIAINLGHAGNYSDLVSSETSDAKTSAMTLHAILSLNSSATNERRVIDLTVTHMARLNMELGDIKMTYRDLYGKELVHDMKERLSRNIWVLAAAGLIMTAEYLAEELHDAFSTHDTDDETIIDIVMIMRDFYPYQDDVPKFYKKLYGKFLLNDVDNYTTGDFKNILLRLIGTHYDHSNIDELSPAEDVYHLSKTLSNDARGREEFIAQVITLIHERSTMHLRNVFCEYKRTFNRNIEDTIRALISGSAKKLVLSMVEHAAYDGTYFARRLHESVDTIGVDYRTINRILISQIHNLNGILRSFQARYNRSLQSFFPDDSDIYAHTLKAFIASWGAS